MKRSCIVVSLALVVSLPAVRVAAQDEDPQALFVGGATAYGEGRYTEAADLFRRAHALLPEPSLLYNLGLALEGAGDVRGAIAAYQQFLADAPDAAERTEVERSLASLRSRASLEEELAREREREPAAPPDPGEGSAPETPLPTSPPATARTPSPVPWVLTAVGLVGVGVGVGLGVSATDQHERARLEPVNATAVAIDGDAQTLATAANVSFAVGGAVALAGAVWGVIDLATLGSDGASAVTLRVVPTLGGGVLTGTF